MALVACQAPNSPSAPELKAIVLVATSRLAKLGVVVPIPILPSGPIVMEPIVEVPEVLVIVIVDEPLICPVAVKFPATVDEPVEINPERLESPLTLRVEENVEEAVEIKPFNKLARPPKIEVLETIS